MKLAAVKRVAVFLPRWLVELVLVPLVDLLLHLAEGPNPVLLL